MPSKQPRVGTEAMLYTLGRIAIIAGLGLAVLVVIKVVDFTKTKIADNAGVFTHPPIMDVSAQQVSDDYGGNLAAADSKYLHKRIRVSGHVREIGRVDGGGYAIYFHVAGIVTIHGRLRTTVVALLPASDRERAGALKDGAPVTVIGTCAGSEESISRGTVIRIEQATIAP